MQMRPCRGSDPLPTVPRLPVLSRGGRGQPHGAFSVPEWKGPRLSGEGSGLEGGARVHSASLTSRLLLAEKAVCVHML